MALTVIKTVITFSGNGRQMLTDTQIKRAMRDVAKSQLLSDGTRGHGALVLLLMRGAKGGVSATWKGRWWADGKERTRALGKYPAMGLAEARERFQADVADKLAAGEDPNAEAIELRRPTLGRMLQGYLASLRERGSASVVAVESALLTGKHCAADALGRDTPAGQIRPADVLAFLADTRKRGAVIADRTRGYLSAAFNWAIAAAHDYTTDNRQDWGVTVNPAAVVKRDQAARRERDRYLSADEIALVWHGIGGAGFDPAVTRAVRLLLCTGQRVRELLRVDGAEIDLDAGLWEMPAAKTKVGKFPHVVPLVPEAVAIFHMLKKEHGDGPLFQPRGNRRAKDGTQGTYMPDTSINHAIKRLVAATDGLDDFQTRDLRRTWKTQAGQAGITKHLRDLIQQHELADTSTRHYDRYGYLAEKKAAMATWGAWLADVVGKQPQAVAA